MKTRVFSLFCLSLVPAFAQATAGLKLRLPAKSPLIVRVSDAADTQEPLSLREPLLYLGGTLTWRPVSKTAELELGGSKALLALEENSAIVGSHRVFLPSAPHWKDGRLILGRASLELVFKSLSEAAPAFESASAEELATLSPPSLALTPAAEPTVVPPAEPELVTGHEPRVGTRPSASRFRRIVIDAGHGGHDPGAHGRGGVEEKDVCLDIALRLARQIHERYPTVDVKLTRDKDFFVTLKNRTVIANNFDADLFISIHNNASPNSKSRGSQVFFYDSRSSDRVAEELAKRENEDSNYLEFIMMDLNKSLVRDQSILLAQSVQNQLGEDLGVKSRRLSYAPFYVLARTKMPAILVEVAFITNPKEEKLLKNSSFRNQVAEGIVAGLGTYRSEIAKQ